ncbi:hypothetical protein ABMA27_014114 [Loxostege sticticalis]|uniref:Uncharacterized protein n=1 Tax=Loxostege sticticalis TaxID=481309 RepID=A0ABR3ICR0_LOXSC
MKPVVLLAVIIGSGFAAPWEEAEELLRTKKSYGAPCAGAAPYAPVALYLSQSPQPHYREDEHIEDVQARSNYGSPLGGLGYGAASSGPALSGGYGSAPHSSPAGLALPAAAHGPAVGLFPNAHVGGCNIPLLLSCAPNVVTGHLAESHGYSSYPAPAYRNIEEETMKKDWDKMARKASHHKVSEDFPEHQAAAASHHVVSEDFPEPNVTRVVPQSLDDKPAKL